MDLIAKAVIPRHCVRRLEDREGMSPMQARLLDTDRPVSVVSAPTGAGKSHVFRKVVESGKRVLFIVPTKRLAQNQAEGIRADLAEIEGPGRWSAKDLEGKVALFTSDESRRLRAAGVESVVAWRRHRLPMLRPGDKGEIVFATPEAVSWLLLNPNPGDGQGDIGPATLMRSFDRIVFDEFHLIQARGFGLAAVCAGLAVRRFWGEDDRAKVALLSATPLNLAPVMDRLGIPLDPARDVILEEIIDDGGRPLHGDVSLEFVQADSPFEVAAALAADIAALPPGQKAVLLYDALKDLKRDDPEIRAFVARIGLPLNQLLIDSSLDAQVETDWSGRSKSLDGRRLIASTSTIEVGVTLNGLVLLVMDPGFSPLSFMQRLGRVARGDYAGRVIVRVSPQMRSQRPWLDALIRRVQSCDGRIPILELSSFMAEQAKAADRFAVPDDPDIEAALDGDAEIPAEMGAADCFETMSVRAAFASGLYWDMLRRRLERAGMRNQAKAVLDAMPPTSGVVAGWLDEVGRKVEGGEAWRRAFEAEAEALRDFTPTVTVVGCDGREVRVSEGWLTKNTTVLDMYPVTINQRGESIVRINDELEWDRLLRAEGDRGKYLRPALLPLRRNTCLIERNPIGEYRQAVKALKTSGITPSQFKSVEKAALVVSATGVVPYVDGPSGIPGKGSQIL